MKNTKLLVVVDESPATRRALEYVAQVASRRRDFRICLAHALPSPPSELVELRGAEKDRIRAYKRRWISVVIGRDSLSWLGELIHGDPAEELVRQGKGFTIWVVE